MPLPPTKVWNIFADFVRAETSIGGPDCQLKLLVALGEEADDIERVWLNGCYGAHHCVPSAYAIWTSFSARNLMRPTVQEDLYQYLDRYWDSLPVRPEMRSHRMIEKRWRCLVDFAYYAMSERWRDGNYQQVWTDSISRVKYYSRYMAIKYLELLRMTVRPDLVLFDMRAKHGWSPRIGLSLLFPEVGDIIGDREDNSEHAIELTEECAIELIQELKADYDVHITHFQLQVLLCNFREMLEGTFYPGAGHDEEIDYLKLAKAIPCVEDVWKTRARIFPKEVLGEHSGWTGIRKTEYQRWKEFGRGVL